MSDTAYIVGYETCGNDERGLVVASNPVQAKAAVPDGLSDYDRENLNEDSVHVAGKLKQAVQAAKNGDMVEL
jgi:hypothetical protein